MDSGLCHRTHAESRSLIAAAQTDQRDRPGSASDSTRPFHRTILAAAPNLRRDGIFVQAQAWPMDPKPGSIITAGTRPQDHILQTPFRHSVEGAGNGAVRRAESGRELFIFEHSPPQ